jgi:hypothetical protein
MASNTVSGPHGRDTSLAETAQNQPASNPPLDTLTFHDVLNAVNPLQYLPVVGTIYRVCTGDEGSPGLRTAVSLVGGALTGGPVGFLTSLAGEMLQRFFPIEHTARAWLTGDPTSAAKTPTIQLQVAAPAAAAAATAGPAAADSTSAASAAPPAVARAAVAAYAQVAGLNGRLIWGGREG